MGTRHDKTWQRSLLTLCVALTAACGGDDEAAPSGGPSLGIDGGIPGLDAGDGTTDGGTAAPGAACTAPTGPATNQQLLNACTEGCQPFDNTKRLPGYTPGQLPPLP